MDLHQEVIVPAAHVAFHGKTFLARMLLVQRQREPSEPRQILGNRPPSCVSDVAVFAFREI